MFIAQIPQSLKKTVLWRNYAHVGSHRLYDHCRYLILAFLHKFFHTGQIVVNGDHSVLGTALWYSGAVRYAAGHNAASCAYQHGVCMAVIAAGKFNDLILSRKSSGRADSAHNCFCSGIDHTDHFHMRDPLADKFRHLHFPLSGAAKAQTILAGTDHRFFYPLIIVSQDHRSPGTDIICIGVSVYIKDLASNCPLDKSGGLIYRTERSDRAVYSSRDPFYCSLK